MIIPDAKKAATVILGKIGKPSLGPAVKPEEMTDPKEEGLKTAAEDVLTAIHEKSAAGLMTALRAFFDQCDSSDGDE